MIKDIMDFGNRIIQETHQKWLIYENQYEIWNYGFGVFYSPIYYKPDLMLIGYNVGGTEKDFCLQECLVIPDEHEYFVFDYTLARKQKQIWEKLNKIDTLRKSVKLNLNFFRSRNIAQWVTVPKVIRSELEGFCINKVKEIIIELNPKIILTEGMRTYDELLWKIFGKESLKVTDVKIKNKRMRIFTKSFVEDKNIFGIAHLSGCRLSEEDIKIITDNLKNYF